MKWWTHSWNPVIGCTPASPGCDNCYAKALHDQRHAAFVAGSRIPACYAKPFGQVTCLEERLARPLGWKKPRRVFVNSMSDLFHPDVPFEFLDRVFAVMALASQHTFMICTKRAERMREYLRTYDRLPAALTWPYPNIWLGVTAENQEQADARIPILLDTPAAKRFVSVEPMLGPVSLSKYLRDDCDCGICNFCNGGPALRMLDWVICGGESGPNARPLHPSWALSLRDQCASAGVPFFFKQLGDLAWFPVPKDLPEDKSVFCRVRRAFICKADPVGGIFNPDGFYAAKVVRGSRLLDGVEHNAMPEVQS
jgi:protein gp37